MSQRAESTSDDQMAAQFERIIRRVKSSMNYRGSYSTRDILGSLVARWGQSGEGQRLRALPPAGGRGGEGGRGGLLGSRVAGWVRSGEWQRWRALPPAERRIGESVRRFILNRLEQLRGRGERV